jgi:DNA invertase Pin-like site-specific DNA recombinase
MSHQKPAGTRLATYERTSKEESHPERQAATLDAWAAAHKLQIARRFVDQGGRRHEADNPKRRPSYAQLLRDIESGLFDVLAVEELSRLGFANEWKLMALCSHLKDHGVELWEARSDKLCNGDDIAGFLTTGIGGHASRKEVSDMGTRSLGAKAVSVRAGAWQGGYVPFGCMVQNLTADGMVRWTVEIVGRGRRLLIHADGREEWFEGEGNFPKDRRKGETLRLAPSAMFPERFEQIRMMYKWFLHESVSMNEIAHRLNDAGVCPTGDEGSFYGSLVERTLRNPINKGVMGYGKHSTARYATLVDGLPRAISGDGSFRRKSRDQWVESPVLFEGPVTAEEWEAAVEKLEASRRGPRVGRNPELIFSGTCWCSHCGKILAGWCSENRSPRLKYACSTYTRLGRHSPCGPNVIPQSVLLDVFRRWLDETGRTLEMVERIPEGDEVAALFPDNAAAGREIRKSMAGVLRAMEDYLFNALAEILPFEEIEEDRRRFTLERHDEPPIVLDLPDSDNPVALQDVYSWAASAGKRRTAESIRSLEATHDRLLRKWDEVPTHLAKLKVGEQMGEVEAELARLRAGDLDLGGRLRGLFRELHGAYARVKRAAKELAGDDLRRQSQALRNLVERIECTFVKEPRSPGSKQLVCRPASVRIVPRDATEPATYGLLANQEPMPRH